MKLLRIILPLAIGMIAAICPVAAAKADKPNVILILADDLGYGELGSSPMRRSISSKPKARTPS